MWYVQVRVTVVHAILNFHVISFVRYEITIFLFFAVICIDGIFVNMDSEKDIRCYHDHIMLAWKYTRIRLLISTSAGEILGNTWQCFAMTLIQSYYKPLWRPRSVVITKRYLSNNCVWLHYNLEIHTSCINLSRKTIKESIQLIEFPFAISTNSEASILFRWCLLLQRCL